MAQNRIRVAKSTAGGEVVSSANRAIRLFQDVWATIISWGPKVWYGIGFSIVVLVALGLHVGPRPLGVSTGLYMNAYILLAFAAVYLAIVWGLELFRKR